jgi:hypothetical protein
MRLRSSNIFPTNSQANLLTTAQIQSKYGSKESAPKPPKPPWITADEATGTVLLSTYNPATAFSDPSGVNTSTALSVFYGMGPTYMPPKPPWMLASQLSTPHSGTWLLQWDPGLLDDSAPHPAWRWGRPLSAGDETTDVAEGLTLGVRTRDHCGCAQAVATGGDSPDQDCCGLGGGELGMIAGLTRSIFSLPFPETEVVLNFLKN